MTRSDRSASDRQGSVIAVLLFLWCLISIPTAIVVSVLAWDDASWLGLILFLLWYGVSTILFAVFIIVNALEKPDATARDPFDRRHPPVR